MANAGFMRHTLCLGVGFTCDASCVTLWTPGSLKWCHPLLFGAESEAAGFPRQALCARWQVLRGFHIGDVDVNCGLQLQLLLMLNASCVHIG